MNLVPAKERGNIRYDPFVVKTAAVKIWRCPQAMSQLGGFVSKRVVVVLHRVFSRRVEPDVYLGYVLLEIVRTSQPTSLVVKKWNRWFSCLKSKNPVTTEIQFHSTGETEWSRISERLKVSQFADHVITSLLKIPGEVSGNIFWPCIEFVMAPESETWIHRNWPISYNVSQVQIT